MTNVRGRGLMCAFDLPSSAFRDTVLERCFEECVIILGSGRTAVRFRTPLIITKDEIDQGIRTMARVIEQVESEHNPVQRSHLHEVLEHPLREEP